jgi:UrcA family protein
MKALFKPQISLAAAALAGGLLAIGGLASAQPSASEVTIVAPRVVHQEVGKSPSGTPIELISLSREVSYADLSLASTTGVATLDKRVADTARQACDQLELLYPAALYPPNPSSQDCFKTAYAEGMAQAGAAIAAAHK